MGSDLFRVTVLDRKGPTVRVRYRIVHPDVFAIEVADGLVLQHLFKDLEWDSRIYDFTYYAGR